MVDFSNIGKALRTLRRQKGLKQAEVAKGAKITSPMLSAYETGKQRPSLATIDKILAALELSARDLSIALHEASDSSENENLENRLVLPLPKQDTLADLEQQLSQILGEDHSLGEISSSEKQFLISLLPTLLWLMRNLKN
ncbi:MAG: helix-turn-helix domain-containing protein [Deltaproteobacteria bacterium]|nr:helix-turn-helix domain-containing protein [Deltaproteobacteria bacterium]